MKKVTKKILLVVFVLLVLLVAAGVYAYMGTDLLKSNKQLFYKYMGKNLDTITDMNLEPYKKMQTTGRTYKMSGKFTSEALNKTTGDKELGLKFDILSDNQNKKTSGNYKLLINGNDFLKIDYIRDNDKYGLKSDEITDGKYLVVENNNLKDLFKKFGIEDVSDIPDRIDTDFAAGNKKIDKKKLKEIQDKYKEIIDNKIPDEKYVEEVVDLDINEETVKTKKYSLTLTEKEVYDIAHDVLSSLKDDTETIEFFLDLIYEEDDDEEVTVEDVKEKLDEALKELEDSEYEVDEEDTIVFSVYSLKGKTIRTEISVNDESKLVYTATKNNNIDNLSFEVFDGEDIETSIIVTNTVSEDNAEILVKISSEDTSDDMEIKYMFTNITDTSVDMNFKGTLGKEEIVSFRGKLELDVKDNIEDVNDNNSIILNSCSDEEFEDTISNVSQKAVTVILSKIQEVAPELLNGLTPNSFNNNYSDDPAELTGSVNYEVTEEVNNALKACQDDYIAAYALNEEIDISDYLNETEVLKKCENAKEVTFTDTGVRYVAKDGTVYEGDVDYNAIATGYVTISGMIEK